MPPNRDRSLPWLFGALQVLLAKVATEQGSACAIHTTVNSVRNGIDGGDDLSETIDGNVKLKHLS